MNAYLVKNLGGTLQVTVFAKSKPEAGNYVLSFYKRGPVVVRFVRQIQA